MKKQKVLIKTIFFYCGFIFNHLNLLHFIYFGIKEKASSREIELAKEVVPSLTVKLF